MGDKKDFRNSLLIFSSVEFWDNTAIIHTQPIFYNNIFFNGRLIGG